MPMHPSALVDPFSAIPVPEREASEADWKDFFNRLPAVLDGSQDSLIHAMLLYVRALEHGRSDSDVAMLLAGKVVETGALTELGIHIYLHACYVCGAHDSLFTYVSSFIDNNHYEGLTERKLLRCCPKQFLMYRYDKEFIEGVVSQLPLPSLRTTPLIIRRHTKLAIITGCDDRYFRRYLYDSILRLSLPYDCLFHVALIDGATGALNQLELIANNAPNISFSNAAYTDYYEPKDLSYISHRERRITTYACHRFFIAEQMLTKGSCSVVLFDSDTDFESIDYARLEKSVNALDCDVGSARWEVDLTPGTSFLADMVVIKPSVVGRAFLKLLTRYCYFYISRGLSFWTLDQVALNAVHHYILNNDIQYKFLDINTTDIKLGCNIRHISSEEYRGG